MREPHPDPSVFAGATGELRQLLETKNWSCGPLGAPSSWSPVLRMLVPTMLRSGFPTVINWGPEMVALYNEAYVPLLGGKHPQAVGQSPKDTWPEAWEWVAPRLYDVFHHGNTVQFENQQQILERNGYPEECYFSFSQSPIMDVDGSIGGILSVATESTRQVLSDRRMRVVREIGGLSVGDTTGGPQTELMFETCQAVFRVLQTARESIPFAVAFLTAPVTDNDPPGGARPVAAYGLADAPLANGTGPSSAWAMAAARVIAGGESQVLSGLRGESVDVVLPGPIGPLLPDAAALLPLTISGRPEPVGAVMLGLSPYQALDQDYQDFFRLIARQLRIALTDAAARESERHRLAVLADLDRAKTEFYQNVSHELRTPLTMLLAPLQDLLAAQRDDDPAREDLEAAIRAAERLRLMVDALLDFSGAEGGIALPDRRPADLAVITADVARMFRSTAEHAGLRFTVQVPEPLKAVVDSSMWSTIVTNLVSNAVKYSSAGGHVTVALRSAGAEAVLTVTDTGIGIDTDRQAKVFDRFFRAEPDHAAAGAGIGLALVSDLVRAHDGRLDLASELGHGTTITVTLPLRTGHTQPLAPAPQRPDTDPAPGSRILLVEDDPDLRGYLTRLLAGDGWSVDAAPDAEAAMRLAFLGEPPAAVITDVMLPGRSGLHLLGQLRKESATARIPILLITGRGGADAAGEGLAAGADDYITKPFSSRELLARVRANHELHVLRESAVEAAEAKADQISRGLETNRTIGTAIGIVMAQHRLTAEQAFRLLTTASQNTNSKLRDIAAAVADSGALPFRPTDVDDLLLRVMAR